MPDAITDPGFLRATEEIPAFRLVTLDTSGPKLGKLATASDDPIGVSRGLTPSGSAIKLLTDEGAFTRVEAGAAVSLGDKIQPDASGKGITASVSGLMVIGKALEEASADGEIIFVLVEKTVLP